MIQPDNFKADPYGYVTNQISHMGAVGCLVFVYGVVLFVFLVAGEFPPKWAIILGAAVSYSLIEALQGWRGWDTIEDWLFVVFYGVTIPVMVFSEVEPGSDQFCGGLMDLMPWVLIMGAHLLIGSAARWHRARKLALSSVRADTK
jgi:hypothetical protein